MAWPGEGRGFVQPIGSGSEGAKARYDGREGREMLASERGDEIGDLANIPGCWEVSHSMGERFR